MNRLFNWLPLAALIEKKIICMHGGIGRSINHVEQIENLQRPITMEAGSVVLMDLLWSAFQQLPLIFTLSWRYLYLYIHILTPWYCDAYRSDPTENDSVEGLRPNARGPGLVTFGVSAPYSLCWWAHLLFPLAPLNFLKLTQVVDTAWSCYGVLQ